MPKHFAVTAALLVGLGACTVSDHMVAEGDCTVDQRPGLVLSVIDSTTGDPISTPSLVIARAGTFADTARTFVLPTYYLLYERAGTYVVTVNHAGYREWSRAGVVVAADRCHVLRLTMAARLQP
jgi:hypothetical protein